MKLWKVITAVLITAVLLISGYYLPAYFRESKKEVSGAPQVSTLSIKLLSPANNSFILPGRTISIDIEDNSPFTANCSVDGSRYAPLERPFNISTSDWNEGNHTVSVSARDSTGKVKSAWFSFVIDLSPPSIRLEFPHNGTAIESSGYVRFEIDDPHLEGANFTLDNGTPQCLPQPYTIPVRWWVEGAHRITVNAIDRAGNRESRWFEITIDNRPTGIRLISPKSSVIRSGTPIVFEIDESDLQSINCTVNGSPVAFSFPWTIDTSGWHDGKYYIEIDAEDRAGHNVARSYIFEVDDTAPDISAEVPDGAYLNISVDIDMTNDHFSHSGGNISFVINDTHLSEAKYSVNGGPALNFGPSFSAELYGFAGNSTEISVIASDSAGNTAWKNMTVHLKYTLHFHLGNNSSEISIPLFLANTTTRDVFSCIDNTDNGSYSRVSTYVDGEWKTFNPAYPDKFNLDLLHIYPYMGLILNIDSGHANFTVSGNLTDSMNISLSSKHDNFIPYPFMKPMRVDSALAGVPWYRVERWDWRNQSYVDMKGDELMMPGHSYWVEVSYNCVWSPFQLLTND